MGTNKSRTFNVASCGIDCHVLIEASQAVNENRVDAVRIPGRSDVYQSSNRLGYQAVDRQDQGPSAVYTIMVYYTPAFAAVVTNPKDSVNTIIAMTNTGYSNSLVNLRTREFCTEELAGFQESEDPDELLDRFSKSKMFYRFCTLFVIHFCSNCSCFKENCRRCHIAGF